MERNQRNYYDMDQDWEPQRSRQQESQKGTRNRYQKPKRRKRRSAASGSLIYILVVFGISALLALTGWSMANDVLALNKAEAEAAITIRDDSSYNSVVKQLKENGIIKYKWLFKLFSAATGGADKISAGTYVLNTDMDYRAIISNMGQSSSSRMTTEVTVTEGMTVDQIFALLEEKGVSTVDKLQDMAASHDYAFSFLQDLPLGDYHRLEGYLFPDTYEFYMGEDPKYVLNKMLVNFDAKFTEELRQQVWSQGSDMYKIVTVASMIEKETDGTDRAKIASVIYNRLNNPGASTAGYLNIDATIQYLLPEGQVVTEEDIETIDSPYNTYKYKGLPPGPISNPGMESIYAAIYPETTNYYYYALGDDGLHHFFTSYSEFQNFLNS